MSKSRDGEADTWAEIGFLLATVITVLASGWTGVGMLFILDGSDSGGAGLLHGDGNWGDVATMAALLAIPTVVLFALARRHRPEPALFAARWTLACALWAWVLALLITVFLGP